MAEFEVVDLSGDQPGQVADAVIGVSNAVLAFGVALVGAPEIRAALDREAEVSPLLAGLMDEQDPAGFGVNEDERRPPEDGEWRCPVGASAAACRAEHDHCPPPRRRRDPR